MKRYKLTRQDKTTHNGFQLPDSGVWFYPEDRISTPVPCSNTVLHHYRHPLLAVLFNPHHANYRNPRLFEIEVRKEVGTDSLKGWCRAQKIVRELPLPQITLTQKVAFAIKVALLVYSDKDFVSWATDWLSGKNRTANAASAAADAARAAYYSAARAATDAARAAYYSAAADAATCAAADAARAATCAAADAYYSAARAATCAARAAVHSQIDFVSIINEVISTQE